MNLIPYKSKAIGQRFTRLVVIATFKDMDKTTNNYIAECQCDCGSDPFYITVSNLTRTNKPTHSCGCYHIDRISTHRQSYHPIFHVWEGMMQRCYSVNAISYRNYGGKGVIVCDRWHDVNEFIKDMHYGYRKGLQLDRIYNNQGYNKENCRWVTTKQQARNRCTNALATFNGETHCLVEWSEIYNIHYDTLRKRVRVLGWPIEKALTYPIRKTNRQKP